MKINFVFLLLLLLSTCKANNEQQSTKATGGGGGESNAKNPIKHLVVLMLENRSFDHMCGYLKQTYNSSITGLFGNESNPIDPLNPNSETISVNDQAPYVDPDPSHSVQGTTIQVFGSENANEHIQTAPMNGFVASAIAINITKESVMSCFNEYAVPTISTMAKEFGLFDHWFSDVPGPTEVNRMYVQSATSHGAATNDNDGLALGYPQKTIYHSLNEANKTFDIFFTDFPTAFFMRDLRFPPYVGHFHLIEEFEEHVNKGQLAAYTFLEPRYYSLDEWSLASDQHPSHDVAEGEYLIQKVYSILRNGPNWNETAFLVTYDEHGGFYDHFPTPLNVPNPDDLVSENPPFNFTRLGVRVPAVLASPWINEATIIKPKASPTRTSQYSHSSVAATVRALFMNTSSTPFLTKRDAWSSPFDDLFTLRSEPRTDCPHTLPAPAHPMKHTAHKAVEHTQPMNDLQKGFVKVVRDMVGDKSFDIEQLRTERDGGLYVMKHLQTYFNGQLTFTDLQRFS